MYSYIKGNVTEKSLDFVIVENNGVGYQINTSLLTVGQLPDPSLEVKLYTHLYVREDIFSLYGFLTRDELKMFLLLLSVSGVGPKAALSIMSNVSPSKFSLCVITDDAKCLTKAQGVGNKLAQRIILELKDKMKKENHTFMEEFNPLASHEWHSDNLSREAVDALLVLGYSREQAYNAVKSNNRDGIELESLIKDSLRSLSR